MKERSTCVCRSVYLSYFVFNAKLSGQTSQKLLVKIDQSNQQQTHQRGSSSIVNRTEDGPPSMVANLPCNLLSIEPATAMTTIATTTVPKVNITSNILPTVVTAKASAAALTMPMEVETAAVPFQHKPQKVSFSPRLFYMTVSFSMSRNSK